MYYVMDAHSFYNFIYFILLIIVSIRLNESQHCKLRVYKRSGIRSTHILGSKLLYLDFHLVS